jgi:hypothetical protein
MMTKADKAKAYDELRNEAGKLGFATVGEALASLNGAGGTSKV